MRGVALLYYGTLQTLYISSKSNLYLSNLSSMNKPRGQDTQLASFDCNIRLYGVTVTRNYTKAG